jgi:hypothetical protein
MFGKPQWFRAKAIGWGLTPTSLQGWIYTGLWAAAIAGPFIMLLGRHQPIEAMAWMGLGIGALVYDVRQILLAMNPPKAAAVASTVAAKREDNVLYIMDDSQTHPRVATRGFNLQTR